MNYKDTILNYSENLWNHKALSAIDDLIAENVMLHSPLCETVGREEFKSIMRTWLEALPDIQVQWDDTICEDNKVVSRWTATGTHQAELLGIPATGRQIKYNGVTIYTFSENKVSEYWAIVDTASIRQQLA